MPEIDDHRLRLAVQKSGRLADDSFDLLARCGLKVRRSRTELYARIAELPIDLLLVRDDDIPGLVARGASDVGIVGGNVFEETRLDGGADGATVLRPLGFSRCRLCIAVPRSEDYDAPSDLSGRTVATSYPELTRAWAEREGVALTPIHMSGAHEIAPRLGLSDAICDIVSTGATLNANGLTVAETIYESEALLIGQGTLSPAKQRALDALTARIEGVLRSKDAKYVMMNAPRGAIDAIRDVLPGADSPTVLELHGQSADMVALHVLTTDAVVWEHLEELKGLGARAILVLDVDKMLS